MPERFIIDHSELKARPSATELQIYNLKNWLQNNNFPLHRPECQYVDGGADLISIATGKSQTALQRWRANYGFVSRIAHFRYYFLYKVKVSVRFIFSLCDVADHFQYDKTRYDDDAVSQDPGFDRQMKAYKQHVRLESFTNWATIFLGLAMLIGPLWILQHVSATEFGQKLRLVVIKIFLVVFTLLLSVITTARPFEVLAATAAYGAVLMVFYNGAN